VVEESLDSWFKREILVHERALRGYIGRVWPHRDEVYDVLQETYVRVYEAGKRSRASVTRPFIFTIARNLVADRQRRARVISIEVVSDPDALNVLIEEITPERRISAWQDLKRVMRALNLLPARSREVIW
jgi:RNA polymerase sigma factor (sigma-70 family)